MKAILRSINNFSCKLKQSNNQKYNISPKTSNNKLKNISDNGSITIEDAIIKTAENYKIYGNTKQSILPDGYTQVDYIESTGTQYIDTGVNADSNLRVIIDMAYVNHTLSNQNVGVIRSNNGGYTRYHLLSQSNTFRIYINKNSKDIGTVDNERHLFDFDIPNNKINYDGTEYSLSTEEIDTELNFWLFGRNSNINSLIYYSQIKQWACKMYYNNVLVRDFIPCFRNSDNEVGLYDLVNNVFYTNQGTGTFLYGEVLPTPDMPTNIVSCGDMTKNLWGGFNYSRTHNGITHTYNIDGTITLNGTSSDTAYSLTTNLAKSNNIYIRLLAGTYTISGGTSDVRLQVISTNGITLCTTYSSGTFTINEETYAYLRTQVIQGKSFDNEVIYIQLEQGPFVTQYEPYYTGYKIPVNVRSDNLFDKDSVSIGYVGISGAINPSYTDYKTSNYIKVKPNATYYKTISGSTRFKYFDKNFNVISDNQSDLNNATSAQSFETPLNARYLRLTVHNDYLNTFLLKEGPTAPSKYIPYYNEVKNIYLNEPLRKIGDYSDFVDFKTGKIIRNINKIIFNGSESGWAYYINKPVFYMGYSNENYFYKKSTDWACYCDYFKGKNNVYSFDDVYNYGNNVIAFRTQYPRIVIRNDSIINLEDFKAWLAENNITVYYVLAIPTEEDIELPELNLIEGKNIITIGTEVQGAIEIEYYSQEIIDISNYKYNLRKVED